jgi:hypothetical protein
MIADISFCSPPFHTKIINEREGKTKGETKEPMLQYFPFTLTLDTQGMELLYFLPTAYFHGHYKK